MAETLELRVSPPTLVGALACVASHDLGALVAGCFFCAAVRVLDLDAQGVKAELVVVERWTCRTCGLTGSDGLDGGAPTLWYVPSVCAGCAPPEAGDVAKRLAAALSPKGGGHART